MIFIVKKKKKRITETFKIPSIHRRSGSYRLRMRESKGPNFNFRVNYHLKNN